MREFHGVEQARLFPHNFSLFGLSAPKDRRLQLKEARQEECAMLDRLQKFIEALREVG